MAQSSADSNHLSALTSDHEHDHHEFIFTEAKTWLPLVPNLVATEERSSVLAIQVTLFPNCGYFSIGTTFHHAVLDGKTLNLFLKSWAHTCRLLIGSGENDRLMISHVSLPMELKPFYDRTSLTEDGVKATLGAIISNQWLDLDGPNNRSLLHLGFKVKLDQDERVRGDFQIATCQNR